MPLKRKLKIENDVELCIWENTELDDYFLSKLEIHDAEKEIIERLKSRKRSEWLSSRYLLHVMSGREIRGEFAKDIHGKPHLMDSDHHVSISHTRDLVAVVASRKLVGVDIQAYVQKIERIQHKFVSAYEASLFSEDQKIEALHIIWGGKESLYKAYGKRGLGFKEHIFIDRLHIQGRTGCFTGRIKKDGYTKDFNLTYFLENDYTLVYAKESA